MIIYVSKFCRKAEGYKEGDYTQHTKLSVTDFINDPKYMDRLALASELVVDKEEYKKHSSTTPEVLECCKDIKILGKADIKLLIYWRKQLAKTLKELESAETGEQEVEGRSPVRRKRSLKKRKMR
ncbi:FTSJ3 [Bugula neritina]|uniref:FTSJ3 n=1 Tax=Bugula neritina TaxID=10212 RepID=A0A7J7JEN9_BUGNE|nr:FTSJ3 [Bugula neritina]